MDSSVESPPLPGAQNSAQARRQSSEEQSRSSDPSQPLSLANFQRARTLHSEIRKLRSELDHLERQFIIAKQKLYKEGIKELRFSFQDLHHALQQQDLKSDWLTTRLGFCKFFLQELMSHPLSKPFLQPFQIPSGHPVFPFLKRQLSLVIVLDNLKNGNYNSSEAFATDVRSVFGQAMFLSDPSQDLYKQAEKLSNLFELIYPRVFLEQTTSIKALIRLCEKELQTTKAEDRFVADLSIYVQGELLASLESATPTQKQEILTIINQESPHLLREKTAGSPSDEKTFTLDYSQFDPMLLFRLHIYFQTQRQGSQLGEIITHDKPAADDMQTEPAETKPALSSTVNLNVVTMTNLNLNDMANVTNLPVIYPSAGIVEESTLNSKRGNLTISVNRRTSNSQAIRSPKSAPRGPGAADWNPARDKVSPRVQDPNWHGGHGQARPIQQETNWTNPLSMSGGVEGWVSPTTIDGRPTVSPRFPPQAEPQWGTYRPQLTMDGRTSVGPSPQVSPNSRFIPNEPNWGALQQQQQRASLQQSFQQQAPDSLGRQYQNWGMTGSQGGMGGPSSVGNTPSGSQDGFQAQKLYGNPNQPVPTMTQSYAPPPQTYSNPSSNHGSPNVSRRGSLSRPEGAYGTHTPNYLSPNHPPADPWKQPTQHVSPPHVMQQHPHMQQPQVMVQMPSNFTHPHLQIPTTINQLPLQHPSTAPPQHSHVHVPPSPVTSAPTSPRRQQQVQWMQQQQQQQQQNAMLQQQTQTINTMLQQTQLEDRMDAEENYSTIYTVPQTPQNVLPSTSQTNNKKEGLITSDGMNSMVGEPATPDPLMDLGFGMEYDDWLANT